jgi:hypothetical protein
MNETIIDLFDLQNDLGGQSSKSEFFIEKLVEQIVSYTFFRRMSKTTRYAFLKNILTFLTSKMKSEVKVVKVNYS